MRIQNRIIAFILLTAMCISMVGCETGGKTGSQNGQSSDVGRPAVYTFKDPSAAVESAYEETEFILTENKKSDYVVVIPAEAAKEEESAAVRLVQYIKEASGVTLEIVKDDQFAGPKALFIGDTQQTQAADITADYNTLGASGHIVKTVGENCYMLGATGTGNHFAVTTFLRNTVGYDMYDDNEVIVVEADTLKLRAFDGEPMLPSFERRPTGSSANQGTEYAYANLLADDGWLLPRDSSNAWHNSLDFLPTVMFNNPNDPENYHPEWFAPGGREVCYTAHGDPESLEEMVDEAVKVIIAAAEEAPDTNSMTFTMQDSNFWCNCDACIASEQTHGSKNASCIILLNKIMDKVNAYMDEHMNGRRITLFFFSYLIATDAPAVWDEATGKWQPTSEAVMPHEGVGVMCAPLHADYALPMNDPKNAEYYVLLEQWRDLGFPIAYWVYNISWVTFFAPNSTFYTDIANYPLYEDAGVVWLYNQGQWQNHSLTAFNHLKEFIQTRLSWDANADAAALTDQYFAAQFKTAAPYMRKFYDSMRVRLAYCTDVLGHTGDISEDGMYSVESFPYGTISEYMGYIDQALQAIEPMKKTDPEVYQLVYDRIIAESLFPRYFLITLYPQYYTNVKLLEMKRQFREDCENIGFDYRKEHGVIQDLWAEWGV